MAAKQDEIFDYRTLRLLVGIVAFALPVVVWFAAGKVIASISASYHSDDSRDLFVGALFIIATLMVGYNGHPPEKNAKKWINEKWASKVAAIAAFGVALFPTTCAECADLCIRCSTDVISVIHYISAVILFTIIAYFCLGPFRERTKGETGKKGQRATIYLTCGIIIILSMVAGLVSVIFPTIKWWTLFLAEWIALWAFGVAWIVSGKVIPQLADENERLKLV